MSFHRIITTDIVIAHGLPKGQHADRKKNRARPAVSNERCQEVQLSSSEPLALKGPASHRLGCPNGAWLPHSRESHLSTTRVQQLSRHRSANELVRNISEKLVICRSFPLSAPMRLPQRSGGDSEAPRSIHSPRTLFLIFDATRRSCDVPVTKIASVVAAFSSNDRGWALTLMSKVG